METEYAGIDYGRGKTNVDKETGIRYGVINQNEVVSAWCDSSEPYYSCNDCECIQGDNDCSNYPCEPVSHYIDDKEYLAECGELGDIFITKSPYYTFAQFCSPCAPGACYLTNSLNIDSQYPGGAHNKIGVSIDDNKAYCFGHDWFWDTDTKKAPYPVYRVADNTLVE